MEHMDILAAISVIHAIAAMYGTGYTVLQSRSWKIKREQPTLGSLILL